MNKAKKCLLVRADFVLGTAGEAARSSYLAWRRILVDALPKMMGCASRCPRAERVSLHADLERGSYTGWLRIPTSRRPDRKQLRRMRKKLAERLAASLLPVHGRLVKLGVRRLSKNASPSLPLFQFDQGGSPAVEDLTVDYAELLFNSALASVG